MNIAIIGTAHPFRGGLAAYNERLAKQLLEEGHDVTIYTFTTQYPDFLFPGESQYSNEPAPSNIKIIRCISSVNPVNWIKMGIRIRKTKPDLVLIKFWLPFMGPCFGTLLRLIKKNKKTKIITIIDNIIPHESRIGDRLFTRYFVKPLDAFVAMSENVLEDINQFDTQKPRLYSPHPVFDNFGEIKPRETSLDKLGLDPAFRYLLFFGLIRDYKGLDLLLKAFADQRFRNSGLKLIIAGEYYADKDTYIQLIHQNDLQDAVVQIDKFIPDSEVADLFNSSDLVVQPYKSATQSGVTQIAYHFNKPMIVTDVGGLREMCPDGVVGYVVQPDPVQIADAILRYFHDTDQNTMIRNITTVKQKYSWGVLTKNIFSLLSSLKE